MTKPKRLPVTYVDVDDTLIRSFGSKRIPMSLVVDHVKKLHEAGFQLYCWSSGGGNYAKESAQELGIEHCFVGFLPKPELMIDDQEPANWSTMRCIHPNQAQSRAPADYHL